LASFLFAVSRDAADFVKSFHGSFRCNKGAEAAMVKAAGFRPFFN
jgi:hypothetical protein